MTIKQIHDIYLKSSEVSIDTRTLKKNALFFAIKGEHFDGNKFAEQAISAGAKVAVIDNPEYANEHTILVENSLKTLQALATYHRQHLNIPVIALTGSNGKTTTKELINAVLSSQFNTYATKGNLNNHLGVPLTLLSMNNQTEIAIVEMGANHHKEIASLCEIAQPDYGYITNFGKAHLEGFGSVEGVVKAKSELYDYLRGNKKVAFINHDDPKQIKQSEGIKSFTFSSENNTDVTITFESASPFVSARCNNIIINSNLIGNYNFSNIAAAITIGTYFKIDIDKISHAINNYTPSNNRSQIIKKNNNTIILDAYNANPTSMKAALESFEKLNLNHSNSAIFLGDMFELGNDSSKEHQAIVNILEQINSNTIVLFGEHFHNTKVSNKIKTFKSIELAEDILKDIKDAKILIKGSRGMALERLLNYL